MPAGALPSVPVPDPVLVPVVSGGFWVLVPLFRVLAGSRPLASDASVELGSLAGLSGPPHATLARAPKTTKTATLIRIISFS
jgi:hypothetical protein